MLRIVSINGKGLGLPWKQGYFLNDMRCFSVTVAAISETRLSHSLNLTSIFGVYGILIYPCPLGESDGVSAVLSRKGLDMKIRSIFLDLGGKLVVLDVSCSDGGAFRL